MIHHINKPQFTKSVSDRLDSAIMAAVEAGLALLTVDKNQLNTTLKADNTPVTVADNIANQLIGKQLQSTAIPIISEENRAVNFAERKDFKTYWLVDPLDGTKEFIRHGDEYCVSIALMVENRPKYGIIFAPALNEIWAGGLGIGVYYGTCDLQKNEDLQITWKHAKTFKKNRSPVIVVSRSDSKMQRDSALRAVKKRFPFLKVEACASAIKLARISTGAYAIHLKKGTTMEWDTAAAHALILENGGDIIDFSEHTSLLYNKPELKNPFFIAYNRSGKALLPNG